MSDNNQRIAELEREIAELKQAISHNNDLIVGLERAFLETVHVVVEDNPNLLTPLIDRLRDNAMAFDPVAYAKYRWTREYGNPDTQLSQPATLLSRSILFDNLSLLLLNSTKD